MITLFLYFLCVHTFFIYIVTLKSMKTKNEIVTSMNVIKI